MEIKRLRKNLYLGFSSLLKLKFRGRHLGVLNPKGDLIKSAIKGRRIDV